MKHKKIILIILMASIAGGILFGITRYIKNNICFLLDTSSVEYMTDPILQNSKKILVVREDFLRGMRTLEEGDLIIYKKYNYPIVRRVASLKGARYFNEWNTNFFQYKNIRVKDKTNRPFNKTEPAFGIHYGIMTLGGTTMKPEGTVVVSDKLNENGTVYSYDVIEDFTGWAYPLNIKTAQTVASIWLKSRLSKSRKVLEDKVIDRPIGFIPQSEIKGLTAQLSDNVDHSHKTWGIIPTSLKRYDMNNDGQKDVVGFIKKKSEYGTSWHFATWFGDQENYHFYRDGHHELSFSVSKDEEKKNLIYDVPCDIIDLAIDKTTLNCQKAGGPQKLILHYQPNGEGYFIDPEESLHEFVSQPGWKKFRSESAGVEFQYPGNLNVVENFYRIKDSKINFIEVKNNDKLVLVIYASPGVKNKSGGVLDMSQNNFFIQNLDEKYFVRQKYLEDNGTSNFVYHQAEFKRKNSEGSLFNAYNQDVVIFGKTYVLSTSTDDNHLKEVDNIIASTKFFPAIKVNNHKKVERTLNQKIQMKSVSLKLPGTVTNHKPEDEILAEDNNKTIAFKDLDVRLIDSEFFYPAHIKAKLLPYQSIKFKNPYGNDGFDADKNKCYHEKYVNKNKTQKVYENPQVINDNNACLFGTGDAGYFIESYYIMDPSKKYILSLSQTNDGEGMFIKNILTLDLATIAKTVKFKE